MGSPETVYRNSNFNDIQERTQVLTIYSLSQLKDLKLVDQRPQCVEVFLFNKSKRFRDLHDICEGLWLTKCLVRVDLGRLVFVQTLCNHCSNFINDEICESLCKALQGSQHSLQTLNLAGNCIGGSGAASIGSFLAFSKV
jgi:hypothetical protein